MLVRRQPSVRLDHHVDLGDGETDVARDLAQQDRRDVAARVMRHGSRTTVGVSLLLVRAPLTNGNEAERKEDLLDLTRFEDRRFRHA